jgi:hypothetical protein
MPKRIAISQSNYIPWKGYFEIIERVDEFVLYDEMQYTRRDWRNRNLIKTTHGLQWLTIPVAVKGRYLQKISETAIEAPGWRAEHLGSIRHAYGRAPFFREVYAWLEAAYAEASSPMLSAVNEVLLRRCCERLGIATPLTRSADYEIVDGKTERLVSICRQAGATTYLSGPAARDYIDETQFAAAGIALEWMTYDGYPVYPQLHGDFQPGVSIVDLFFNTGPDAPRYAFRRAP